MLLLRLMRKTVGWMDFILLTALIYLMSWLPWRGTHPVARIFPAWCRTFVRALDVDLRLHQKNRKRLPARFILIANHPSAFEDKAGQGPLARSGRLDDRLIGQVDRAGCPSARDGVRTNAGREPPIPTVIGHCGSEPCSSARSSGVRTEPALSTRTAIS